MNVDKPRPAKKSRPEERSAPAEKPISLRPLEFEEAVRGLLKVKPDTTKSESTCKRETGNG